MRYLYAVALLGALYAVLHYFTELSQKQKFGIVGLVLYVVAGAAAYNAYRSANDDHVRETVLRFERHETLECGGVKVNDRNYTYSVGTQSFIANEGTPNAGGIYTAADCR